MPTTLPWWQAPTACPETTASNCWPTPSSSWEHGGIDSVRVLRAVADTAARRADVYLLLCFGDSTKEEVLVPMVGGPEKWRLK